ncbi:hypothetical protein [Kitasatospora purpeofusca]|uniref:hypothetical protein n=1 Tax=Kitasatospora purpeofusca TaxID=67352 RepID=UPI003649CF63
MLLADHQIVSPDLTKTGPPTPSPRSYTPSNSPARAPSPPPPASATLAAAVTGLNGTPPLLTPATIADATRELTSGPGFLGFDMGARWGSGFLLASPTFRPMLSPTSFGNDGADGQFTFADPTTTHTFAYTTNRLIGHTDPRANNLAACVGQAAQGDPVTARPPTARPTQQPSCAPTFGAQGGATTGQKPKRPAGLTGRPSRRT